MTERLNAIVGAKISEFRRKMAEVKKIAKTVPNKIVVDVEARVKKFQSRMDRLASTIRSLQTVGQNIVGGGLLAMSPGAVPVIAAAAGLIGALGPMIGTVAGSTFALGSAFGFAGLAAIGFGAAAIPTISKLFGETEKLTKAQKAARAEYDKFQKTWQGIVKDLEKPVLEAFGKAMGVANKALKMASPMFESAATAVNNLLDSLSKSLDSAPVKEFFDYMNKNAGPMLETLGKAGGKFTQGFLSMMTAFGPLAEKTAQGFLNMASGFADWAAGLSKSEKFQAFVKYINENMPKIRAIFRDALAGITYFFAAFGPLSSDMMTSLQEMMGRFKEWAKTLSENQQFQKFIGYIRDNAPTVVALIGNLVKMLVNFGIAVAPIGSWMLNLVNNFVAWAGSMLKAHPWIGKIIAGLMIAVGVFQMITPLILAAVSLFSGFGGTILKVIPKLKKFGTTITKSINGMIVRALPFIGRIGTALLRFAGGPIGIAIQAVIALGLIIYKNWDQIKAWTIKAWSATSQWVSESWGKMVSWTKEKASNIASTVKEKFNRAKEAIQTAMTNAKNKVTTTLQNIKSTFTSKITNIVSTVKSKFSDIVNAVRGKMSDVKSRVTDGINQVKSYLSSINLFSMGADMIRGLINGIGSMARELVSKAKGVVGNAIEGAKRLLRIGSPSKVFHQFGRWTGEGFANGMDKMKKVVGRASQGMAKAAYIEPQRMQLAYDTSLTSGDFGRIKHQFETDVNDFELPERDIVIVMDGKEVGRGVEKHVTEQQVGKRKRSVRFQ